MGTESAARRWAAVLHEAWTAGDVESFLTLYAPAASLRGAFGGPEEAAAHMRPSFAVGHGRPEVWVGGAGRAGRPGGGGVVGGARAPESEGRVVEGNDYWQSGPGRFEPWAGWGRAQRQA